MSQIPSRRAGVRFGTEVPDSVRFGTEVPECVRFGTKLYFGAEVKKIAVFRSTGTLVSQNGQMRHRIRVQAMEWKFSLGQW